MLNVWSRRVAFSSVSIGLSGTAEGNRFRVQQDSGNGFYVYTVVGGAARFDEVVPANSQILAIRDAEAACSAAIADLICHAWGTNGYEWDGRVIPNEVGGTPTLNIVPDPFNPVDEDGGSTPTRSINDAGITDPDGGHNALKATFTAQLQQLALINAGDDVLPTDNYIVRGQFQNQSGGTAYRIGGNATSNTSFTADGSWSDPLVTKVSLTNFANAVNLGFSSATGNTDGVLGAYNLQIFDPLAGTVYPSAAVEKAGMDFHAKRPAAYKGSLAFSNYALDTTAETDGINLIGPPDRVTLNEWAMGCWVNCTSEPTSTAGIAMGFDFHTGGATGLLGQFGVAANNGSGYNRFGMFYCNPGLSTLVDRSGQYLVGEGFQHLALSMDSSDVITPYINNIPVNEITVAGYTSPVFSKLLLGSYQGISRRRKVLEHLSGYLQGWWFIDRAVTQSEMAAQDLHGRQRFAAIGDSRIGLRKMAVFGCCDSITAFQPSYFWHLSQDRSISPRIHAYCEAEGGTNIDDWVANPRAAFRTRQIQAAVDAGYTRVLTLHLAGMNEVLGWYGNTYHGTGGLTEWIVDYTAYIAQIKAISNKVRCVALTMTPRATGGDVIYSAASLGVEQKRQEWNDYLRAHYLDMGFDYLIDVGLGTERIDSLGAITAESVPGGHVVGNYRTAAGCVTYSANPAATITLSALSGSSFTATAAAGTFTYQDVGRKVSAGTGVADITAVNGAGSVATLSTDGYAPTGYTNEPAGSVTRDTITRAAFDALSYTSGNWTVANAVTWTGTDGIHDLQPRGRLLNDRYVSPALAAIQAAL